MKRLKYVDEFDKLQRQQQREIEILRLIHARDMVALCRQTDDPYGFQSYYEKIEKDLTARNRPPYAEQ